MFVEIGGRRGYFLVVSLPDGECSGGFESGFLGPGTADAEAEGVRGRKAIFWHYWDEQPKGLGNAVRHLVGPVPMDRPELGEGGLRAAEREWLRLRNLWPRDAEAERRLERLAEDMREPRPAGVWEACEAWLLAMEAEPRAAAAPRRI